MCRERILRRLSVGLLLAAILSLGILLHQNAPDALEVTVVDTDWRVDLNTAVAAELEELPGIGPALAEAIVAYRQDHGAFTEVHGLMEVPGIGEKKFAKLRQLIIVKEALNNENSSGG